MPALRDRILQIIAAVLDIDQHSITESLSPQDLENWDSTQHVILLLAIEDEFDVTFTDDEILRMDNIAAIIAAVLERKGATSGDL